MPSAPCDLRLVAQFSCVVLLLSDKVRYQGYLTLSEPTVYNFVSFHLKCTRTYCSKARHVELNTMK